MVIVIYSTDYMCQSNSHIIRCVKNRGDSNSNGNSNSNRMEWNGESVK